MFVPGGAGLAGAESVAQNHVGSTRPSVLGRFFARNHLRSIFRSIQGRSSLQESAFKMSRISGSPCLPQGVNRGDRPCRCPINLIEGSEASQAKAN